MASAVSGKTPPPQAQPGVGTDPATSRFRAPAAQLPQHLLAGGDGVQELPLPLFHGVQQLLGAFISGRLRGWPPAEPQPRLPTVHAGSLPARRETASGPALGGARSRPQPTAPRARSHPRDQPAPGPHSIAARATRPPTLCSPPLPLRRARIPLSRAPPRPHRSPSNRLGVAVPLSCPARRRGRASRIGS